MTATKPEYPPPTREHLDHPASKAER
jgi:hypothetical protein